MSATEDEDCIACLGTTRQHQRNAPQECTNTANCPNCDPCLACQTVTFSAPNSPVSPEAVSKGALESTETHIVNNAQGETSADIPLGEPQEASPSNENIALKVASNVAENQSIPREKPKDQAGAPNSDSTKENLPSTDEVVESTAPQTTEDVKEAQGSLPKHELGFVEIDTKNSLLERESACEKKETSKELEANETAKTANSKEKVSATGDVPLSIDADENKNESGEVLEELPSESRNSKIPDKRTNTLERISQTTRQTRLSQSSRSSTFSSRQQEDLKESPTDDIAANKRTAQRTGRRKKDGLTIGTEVGTISSGQNSAIESPSRETLQSVKGTLANSKRYQRRGESPNRKRVSTAISNRPLQASPKSGDSQGPLPLTEGRTGESLDNVKDIVSKDRTEGKRERRESRVQIIQKQLSEDSDTKDFGDGHAKSLELLNDEKVTKRQTQVFDGSLPQKELAKLADAPGSLISPYQAMACGSNPEIAQKGLSIAQVVATAVSTGDLPIKSGDKASSDSSNIDKTSKDKSLSQSINSLLRTNSENSISAALKPEKSKTFQEQLEDAEEDDELEPFPTAPLAVEEIPTELRQSNHRKIASPIASDAQRLPYRKFKTFKEWSAVNVHMDSRVGVFKDHTYSSKTISMTDISSARDTSASMICAWLTRSRNIISDFMDRKVL